MVTILLFQRSWRARVNISQTCRSDQIAHDNVASQAFRSMGRLTSSSFSNTNVYHDRAGGGDRRRVVHMLQVAVVPRRKLLLLARVTLMETNVVACSKRMGAVSVMGFQVSFRARACLLRCFLPLCCNRSTTFLRSRLCLYHRRTLIGYACQSTYSSHRVDCGP